MEESIAIDEYLKNHNIEYNRPLLSASYETALEAPTAPKIINE